MPIVQYVSEIRDIRETRNMFSPKRITSLPHWLKEAQKTIPKIPRLIALDIEQAVNTEGHDGWYIFEEDVSVDYIKWTIKNKFGEKAHIVIDRKRRL